VARASHRFLGLVALLAAAVTAYALRPRDESRIADRLTSLARAASQVTDNASLLALRDLVRADFAENASLRVAELAEPLTDRAAIAEHAADLLQAPAPFTFTLSTVEIRVDGHAARAEADLAAVARGQSTLPRDVRHATVLLSRVGSEFVIDSLDVARELHEQPEARP